MARERNAPGGVLGAILGRSGGANPAATIRAGGSQGSSVPSIPGQAGGGDQSGAFWARGIEGAGGAIGEGLARRGERAFQAGEAVKQRGFEAEQGEAQRGVVTRGQDLADQAAKDDRKAQAEVTAKTNRAQTYLGVWPSLLATVMAERGSRLAVLEEQRKGVGLLSANPLLSDEDAAALDRQMLDITGQIAALNRKTVLGDVLDADKLARRSAVQAVPLGETETEGGAPPGGGLPSGGPPAGLTPEELETPLTDIAASHVLTAVLAANGMTPQAAADSRARGKIDLNIQSALGLMHLKTVRTVRGAELLARAWGYTGAVTTPKSPSGKEGAAGAAEYMSGLQDVGLSNPAGGGGFGGAARAAQGVIEEAAEAGKFTPGTDFKARMLERMGLPLEGKLAQTMLLAAADHEEWIDTNNLGPADARVTALAADAYSGFLAEFLSEQTFEDVKEGTAKRGPSVFDQWTEKMPAEEKKRLRAAVREAAGDFATAAARIRTLPAHRGAEMAEGMERVLSTISSSPYGTSAEKLRAVEEALSPIFSAESVERLRDMNQASPTMRLFLMNGESVEGLIKPEYYRAFQDSLEKRRQTMIQAQAAAQSAAGGRPDEQPYMWSSAFSPRFDLEAMRRGRPDGSAAGGSAASGADRAVTPAAGAAGSKRTPRQPAIPGRESEWR